MLGIDYSVNEMQSQIKLSMDELQKYFGKLDRETDEFIKVNIDEELRNEFLEVSKCLSRFDVSLLVEQVTAIGIEMYKQAHNMRSFKIDKYDSIEKLLNHELRQFKTERKNKHGRIRYYAYPILLSSIYEAEYKK